jgi:signal transduction histidine kinase
MRWRPQTLRGLTIAFLALFLTVTAAAGLGTFFATLSMIVALVDERVEAESHAIAPVGAKFDWDEWRERITEMARQRDTADLGMLLTDAQGRRIAGNVRFTRPLPLGFSSLDRRDRIEGLSAGRVLVRDLGQGVRLAVFAETEPIDDYFAVRQRLYIAGFGAIVVVVLAGLLLFRRLIGERIEQMRMTAESIIDGDIARRVPLVGDDGEFDQQAAALNRMLDRMGQLMAEVRNVSNDISHEMRTPLARLRNELALLEQRDAAAPVREALMLAIGQADDLLTMFGAMLRIAEIESGARRAGFQSVALDALVEEMIEMVRPLAAEKDQRIAIILNEPAQMAGDRQLLSQMLINLLENAVRHTPVGADVRVSLERGQAGIRLAIADNGPGIAADQRALAMRRFGRTDVSRHHKGHGLGLPLADAIVRLHRGTLTLEDAGPGLRIVMTFPI